MPTLVSMARSGETFITRDDLHGLRLHLPPGARGGGPIDEATAQRAVGHGFVPVERTFDSWAELDDYVQAEAARFTPGVVVDIAAFDLDDVAELLDGGRAWVTDGEGERARRLYLRLLLVPVVLETRAIHGEIVSRLQQLDRADAELALQALPSDPAKREARQVWEALVPAS